MNASPGWILLAVGLYGLLHSLMASLQFKVLARRWLGSAGDRYYRLIYNLIGFLSLLPVLALVGLLPDRRLYTIPFPWVVATLAGQGLGALLILVGLWQTGIWSFLGIRQLLGSPETAAEDLVVSGLYRWVRHPQYTAGLALIWLSPVMTVNLLALNMGLTAYIVLGAWFEERKLRHVFGEAYRRYQASTPMLIPRPWRRP